MKTVVDERLRAEAARYAFRHTCGDCVYFATNRDACVHGYPTELHRVSLAQAAHEIVFCKEFEIA